MEERKEVEEGNEVMTGKGGGKEVGGKGGEGV